MCLFKKLHLKILSEKWLSFCLCLNVLTHWGRVTHICVGKLTIIGSNNGLSPERRQAIIWTNAGILLIGPLGTNFSENLIEIQIFSFEENTFENVVCEMAVILSGPQCVYGCNGICGLQCGHSGGNILFAKQFGAKTSAAIMLDGVNHTAHSAW